MSDADVGREGAGAHTGSADRVRGRFNGGKVGIFLLARGSLNAEGAATAADEWLCSERK